jgi:hypothetical protein
LAECLGHNDTEHDNKGAGKVNRMSPGGELKTSEAACASYVEQVSDRTTTDLLLLNHWDDYAARNGG